MPASGGSSGTAPATPAEAPKFAFGVPAAADKDKGEAPKFSFGVPAAADKQDTKGM